MPSHCSKLFTSSYLTSAIKYPLELSIIQSHTHMKNIRSGVVLQLCVNNNNNRMQHK